MGGDIMGIKDQFENDEKIDVKKNDVEDHKEETNTVDRFTEFMFGSRPTTRKQEKPINKDEEDQKDEVNYFTLMEQIDDIMVSLENLKPMLKELSPIMEYIKKKI
jgi:hypothetical protein